MTKTIRQKPKKTKLKSIKRSRSIKRIKRSRKRSTKRVKKNYRKNMRGGRYPDPKPSPPNLCATNDPSNTDPTYIQQHQVCNFSSATNKPA